MPAPSELSSTGLAAPVRHILWVAEAALGRLRRTVPSGGLVDDGDGFAFLVEDPRELERIVSELTATAAFGVARIANSGDLSVVEAVAEARHQGREKLRGGPGSTPRMAAIATPVVCISSSTTGEQARRLFLDDETLTTLVYADEHRHPVAALGRERLFRMFSGQYGYAVFAARPVIEAAEKLPRTISADTSIVEAATTVANRESDVLFDDILVVDAVGRVVGVVRVRDLLRALTTLGVDRTQQLNPLTGLAGNARTEQALAEILDTKESLVVSRVDIVDFKSFNERAGFTAGDRTIQALGHAVADVARTRGVRFVGHLGGDDFIVAWNDANEAVVGAIEIGVGLIGGLEGVGALPAGVEEPELAVSTLVLRPGELREVTALAGRLAALKDEVRRHGGAVHAVAHLETIQAPSWRPLHAEYVAVAGQVASMLRTSSWAPGGSNP
jgi:GGDEF domain-containing protein